MHGDFVKVKKARSELLKGLPSGSQFALSSGVPSLQGFQVRVVTSLEVNGLETRCSCRSDNWKRVFVASRISAVIEESNLSPVLAPLVSCTHFTGTVVLLLTGTPSLQGSTYARLPRGIHRCSSVSNCIVAIDSARVHGCTILADTYIDSNAVVLNCGSVTCKKALSEQLVVDVGPETGGKRSIRLTPEDTMIDVGRQLHAPSTKRKNSAIEFNVIGRGALVRDVATVQSVYLHPDSSLQGASRVEHCILLPNATIQDGSAVKNCFLQWDCTISGNSSVEGTILMEQASVGPSSVVASSVLGPDVHVSAGEVHASILGPNCNAHHQSLLIGVIWPTGRGNVGYGANVGSNHTGRIPDQECWAGEGLFWGLSCVVKFPVELSCAPYSVVAAGCSLSPQRCAMPFSLFVSSKNGGSAIIPGWVLRSSPYTIARSEAKFAKRRKARRHIDYTGWKILRPETVQLCYEARAALMDVSSSSPSGTYRSDKDIRGIGDNELSEKGRLTAIQTYTDCIQLFALRGLLQRIKSVGIEIVEAELANPTTTTDRLPRVESDTGVPFPRFPWDLDQSEEWLWLHQRSLLSSEFGETSRTVRNLLPQLLALEKDYADRIYKSKRRDDLRGAETIPLYRDVHVLVDQDTVVEEAMADFEETKQTIKVLLDQQAVSLSKL